MDEGWIPLLVLGALATGVIVGQRVRAGARRPRVATGAAAAAPEQNYTYSHTVAPSIAAACGCS